jgi:hypothetical protein
MNEEHTCQRTDTVEGERIAQGVIQREKSVDGKKEKKKPLGQCQCSRVSQMPWLPRRRSHISLNLSSRPPIIIRPASLYTVQTMPRHIRLCHSIVRKDVESLSVRRSTSGSQRTLELHP